MIIEDDNGREWTTEELDDYREPTEPDPEPLDLDEIEATWNRAMKTESVKLGADAENIMFRAVPDLIAAMRDHREAEEVWAELDTRSEWAMTVGDPPGPDARWYDTPEEAEQRHGAGGQLWMRHLTIGNPVSISSQPPF